MAAEERLGETGSKSNHLRDQHDSISYLSHSPGGHRDVLSDVTQLDAGKIVANSAGIISDATRDGAGPFAGQLAVSKSPEDAKSSGTVSAAPAVSHPDYAALALQATSALTPTVSEFLNGAISEYVIGGVPAGAKPFLIGGHQAILHDDSNGAVAHAWITGENQILITYAGTTRGENLLIDPAASVGGIISDLHILLQQTSSAQTESLGFAKSVLAEAAKQGYGQDQVFVTGHSLGGIEAEYVAQQTGLGGISFEATGIRPDAAATGHAANFVNVVTNGDPVGNYSSDVKGEQPFSPSFVSQAQGGGTLPHYGSVLQIGAASDQAALSAVAGLLGHAFSGDSASFNPIDAILHPVSTAAGLAAVIPLFAAYHLPAAEYRDLGVTPTPGFLSEVAAHAGVAHGAILPVSNDTISALQTYIAGHTNLSA